MNKSPEPSVLINRAVKHFGTKAALARFLGIHQASISGWLSKGQLYLPRYRALQVVMVFPALAEMENNPAIEHV